MRGGCNLRASLAALLLLTLPHLAPLVQGHGRLIEPPSRASAWRYGFSTPPDYNDHELYCGGFSRQWDENGGRCGVCGDAWDLSTPRPHELGGAYGQGIIVRRYHPRGLITVRVELTANHNGHFEFRLCTDHKNTTQECLDKHVLRLAAAKSRAASLDDPLGYRFFPKDGNKIYEMRYRLPEVSCKHCVLQWIYISGNNWGVCSNGTGAVGCGPQEEFRACADISIGSGTQIPEIPSTTKPTTSTQRAPSSELPPTEEITGHGVTTLVIVAVALFIVVILLALVYSYYYQVGKRIKTWLKGDKPVVAPTLPRINPVPPPRIRRPRLPSEYDGRMYNVSLDNESIA